MTTRLRIAAVGGGLIAQAVHLPNLRRLSDQFELVAIADSSPIVAAGLADRYPTARAYTDWHQLIDEVRPDALLVCSPHQTHAEITLAALDHGTHVLVEKPLCIDPNDALSICRRRDERGLVVQVGYMKRYDRAYEAFIEGLSASIERLRLISVTTYDPWMAREPFVRAAELIPAHDIPEETREAGRVSLRDQVERATGRSDPRSVRAYSHTFLACLIHDINLVHGVLDRLGLTLPLAPLAASDWADGDGASILAALPNGVACNCSWIQLSDLDEFREHATAYFTDSIHEIAFPAPYDATATVRHSITGANGQPITAVKEINGGGFLDELRHFHSCITDGERCRTPPEQAARDIEFLRDAFLTTPDHSLADAPTRHVQVV